MQLMKNLYFLPLVFYSKRKMLSRKGCDCPVAGPGPYNIDSEVFKY